MKQIMAMVSRGVRLRVLACVSTVFAVIIAATATANAGNGDSVRTFPLWEERSLSELVNRARVMPSTELAGCGMNCTTAELNPTCYTAVSPLAWNFGLNNSSRFHSSSMAFNSFFNHDTPYIIRNDIASVFP